MMTQIGQGLQTAESPSNTQAESDDGPTYKYESGLGPYYSDLYLQFTWGVLGKRQKELAEALPAEGIQSLVDVGCGTVPLFWILATLHPDRLPVEYTGFDMDVDAFNWVCERWLYLQKLSSGGLELDIEDHFESMRTIVDDRSSNIPVQYRLLARLMKNKMLAADFESVTVLSQMQIISIEDDREKDPQRFCVRYKLSEDLDPQQTERTFTYNNVRVDGKTKDLLESADVMVAMGLTEHEPEFDKFVRFMQELACNTMPKMIAFSLLREDLKNSPVGILQQKMSKMAVIFGAAVPNLCYHGNVLEHLANSWPGYDWSFIKSFGARVLVIGKSIDEGEEKDTDL